MRKPAETVRKYRQGKNLTSGVFTGVYLHNDMPEGKTVFDVAPSDPVKMIVTQKQCPGDLVVLSAALRDLCTLHPNKFQIGIELANNPELYDIFDYNPYIYELDPEDPDVIRIQAECGKQISQSNEMPGHYIHAFHRDFERKLGIKVRPDHRDGYANCFKGDIHLRDEEKDKHSMVFDKLQKNVPFWLLNVGYKDDVPIKSWGQAKYQELVDQNRDVTFVQIGREHKGHHHPRLEGPNVVDLVGQTSIRDVILLMYWAAGVVTGVSFLMHLSAAMKPHPKYKRKIRPCIVIAGGRETAHWEQYPGHAYFHTIGMLPCCSQGGCWKARVKPLHDGKDDPRKMCRMVDEHAGEKIAKCMNMFHPIEVGMQIERYLQEYNYYRDWPKRFVRGEIML
jgi:ADP-heptose:LPS heptosyltransferase